MSESNKTERKLSKAELKRKEQFEAMAEKLAGEGYTQKMIGISNLEMTTKSLLVTIPIMILFVILYFLLGHEWNLGVVKLLISLVIFFVLVVVHEGLHGITWALFAKSKLKSISFGIIMESFTPYCNCNEPLKKYQIILGSIMPTVILGVGVGVASLVFGSTMLLVIALFNLMGCGGDLLVILKLLSYKSDATDILFIDHPYEIGTAVFERK